MSGARRYGPVAAVLCAGLFCGACRVGRNPALSPAATSPRGIVVQVEWDARPRQPRPEGELLGVDEQGVYLLHAGGVMLYPFGSALVLRPNQRPPEAFDVEVEDEARLQEFTKYARYPFGLGGGVLQRMMVAIGVDSVVVMRRP